MSLDNVPYQNFLEELQDLVNFRQEYSLDNSVAGIEGDDPDVKRIIEALAFFGARTKITALRSIDATNRRLYQQFFSFMLSPLPAMLMLQAIPNGHLTETLIVPAGTEFALEPKEGGLVMFRNTRTLRILPITIDAVKQELSDGNGVRLLLSFEANFALNEEPGVIKLHINYLNDFDLSHKAFFFLKNHLNNATVQFGVYDENQPNTPCGFGFNPPPDEISSDEFRHPLEIERSYFQFPQQELFLELDIPSSPRNWKQFTVIFELDKPWPRQLRLNQSLFQLFVSPAFNNIKAMAQPIICDGTQERYTIRHSTPELGFSLQNVLGVYEVGLKGMLPFRPGILAGGNGSFEIEQGPRQESPANLYWLVPHFPAAFDTPRTLLVEALWQQPWYDQIIESQYTFRFYNKHNQGVQWASVGSIMPHAENRQLDNVTQFINLFTLMHITSFNIHQLKELLVALGSITTGIYRNVYNNLLNLRLDEEPLGEKYAAQNKQIYYLQFKSDIAVGIEIIDPFVLHVERVLDLWISDVMVEARWEILDEKAGSVSEVNK